HMKKIVLALMIVTGVLSTIYLRGDDPTHAKKNAKLMEKKLALSQEFLPALANEDFTQMKKTAEALSKLAKQQWIENDTPEYQAQLKDFWVVVDGIGTSAKEKNLDEATLGYVQMTISCVKCHKTLRKNLE
ncbi:MAG: hypothetical protein KDA84_25880, partial [Planctomycetaceae bacterium]|nr:hypothetical protein [Planctomycetaceae bacterium]